MPVENQVCIFYAVTRDYLKDVPVERIPEYEAGLYERMAAQYSDVLDAIRINGDLTASQEERLKTAISSYTADFLGERAQEA